MLLVEQHPTLGVALGIAVLGCVHAIYLVILPVASGIPVGIVTCHKLVVGGAHGAGGLEDGKCAGILTLPVDTLTAADSPLGAQSSVEELVQRLGVSVVARAVDYAVGDRCRVEEHLARAEAELRHLQKDVRHTVHRTRDLYHVVLVGSGLVALVELEVGTHLVLCGEQFTLALIHYRPVGILHGLLI